MTKLRWRGTLGVALLVLALAGFAGPAGAGNGSGNGNGNGNGHGSGNSDSPPAAEPAASPAPGNSGNAPGHNKDSVATAPAEAASAGATTGNGNSANKGGGNHNSPSEPGVKPAKDTAKNTSCATGVSGSAVTCHSTGPVSAPASGKADASKKYGNGRTAAQIAAKNGAAPGTQLHGPGNSQPHKVVTCGHRHGVDVHALKSHPSGKGCPGPNPPEHPQPPPSCLCKGDPPHDPALPPTTSSNPPAQTPDKRGGDVAPAVKAEGDDLHGVLASAAVIGHGSLPFTGFPLWAVMAIGVALILLGLALRGPSPSRVKQGLEHRFGPRRR